MTRHDDELSGNGADVFVFLERQRDVLRAVLRGALADELDERRAESARGLFDALVYLPKDAFVLRGTQLTRL